MTVQWYDKSGSPITTSEVYSEAVEQLIAWEEKMFGFKEGSTDHEYFKRKEEYRRVEMDEVNGTRISTIWIGIGYPSKDGKPQIFETAAFDMNTATYDELDGRKIKEVFCLGKKRSSMLEEAKQVHEEFIKKYSK